MIIWRSQGTATVEEVALDDDATGPQESGPPLVATPAALADQWGDLRFTDVEDPGESETGTVAGQAFQTALLSGVSNADFAFGPIDAGAPIDIGNPIPGWTPYPGTAITMLWVEDTAAPSGYAIQFSGTFAYQDEAYLEQIVPVSPRLRTLAPLVRVVCSDSPYLAGWIETTFLDATGLASGTAVRTEQSVYLSTGETVIEPRQVPAAARYMRVRVGAYAIGSGTDTLAIHEVYAGEPRIIYSTIVATATNVSGTSGPTGMTLGPGSPDGGAQRWIAPGKSWVSSIGLRTSDDRTAGSIEVDLRDESALNTIGSVSVNGTYTRQRATRYRYDPATNSIAPTDVCRPRLTSTNFSPPVDVVAHITIATVDEDYTL